MKKINYYVALTILCCVLPGCVFIPTSHWTVHKWQNRINDWLPVGTPRDDIVRIMKKHGFETTYEHKDSMAFSTDTGMNWIWVYLTLANGKLAAPPTTIVSRSGDM